MSERLTPIPLDSLNWTVSELIYEHYLAAGVLAIGDWENQPIWTNHHLIELGHPATRILHNPKWKPGTFPEAGKYSLPILIEQAKLQAWPLGAWKVPAYGFSPVVILDSAEGVIRIVNASYYAYFKRQYPTATWWIGTDDTKPIVIRMETKAVGLIMPIIDYWEAIKNSKVIEKAREEAKR